MISSGHSQYTLQTHRPAASLLTMEVRSEPILSTVPVLFALSLAYRPAIRDPTVHQATVDKGSEAGSIGDGTTTPCFSPPVVMVIQFISLCCIFTF
jgi:hypothetical protein